MSNAISDMSAVRAKLKLPAIGIIVIAGINLALFLFGLMWLGDVPEFQSAPVFLRAMQTLCILFLLAFAFSIYGAVQMMNARKYGFAITSAIIIILTILCGFPLGFPFGIWALIVLLKPEIKSAFARNSMV